MRIIRLFTLSVLAISLYAQPAAVQRKDVDPGKIAVAFVDGSGSALAAATGCTTVDIAGTITAAKLLGDVSGNATVTVTKVAQGSYTGIAGAPYTAVGAVSMTGATQITDTTLAGWTTTVAAGDVFCFALSSPATITNLVVSLKVILN